eukprot:maker-scaffold133_size323035-snap-gene-0.26 protein:Tk02232 transcript:maker-scaffold133_size323035-snap-gene-0.26-mRNA-1 annotation:"hypothetical protein"
MSIHQSKQSGNVQLTLFADGKGLVQSPVEVVTLEMPVLPIVHTSNHLCHATVHLTMDSSWLGSFMIKVALAFLLVQLVQSEEDECPRYSLEELKASVFEPHFQYELDLIKDSFELVSRDVDELVGGLKDGKYALKPPEIQLAITTMRQELDMYIKQVRQNQDQAWAAATSPSLDGGLQPLPELRLKFQRIHQEIHRMHLAMVKPFQDLAKTCKVILEPMVRMVKMFLSKADSGEPDAREKIFKSIREKDKFIGLVLAEIVQADIDEEPLLMPDMVAHINHIWAEFTIVFYEEGLKKEVTYEEFWKVALPMMWPMRSNLECEASMDLEECKKKQMLSIVSGIFYNTEPEGEDWFQQMRQAFKERKENEARNIVD